MMEREIRFVYPEGPPKQTSFLSFASFESKPLGNPWVPLHDGTVDDQQSLADWEILIPHYGCQCRAFYGAWKAQNPPDFTSPEAFFAWGVSLHNAVNRKLGKPEITLDDAYSIWRSNNAGTTEISP